MTVYGCAGYGRPIGGAVTDGIEAVYSLETIDDQGLSVPPPPLYLLIAGWQKGLP